MSPSAARPLQGLRVLDLSRHVPGAYCTLLLARQGAVVTKIEDPAGGDLLRSLEPLIEGTGALFRMLHRGKRSVTIDLRDPRGRAILDPLLDACDVVVHSFRVDAARRLRVDAPRLRRGRPRLVHCAIAAYRPDARYSAQGAHDLNIVARSGLLDPVMADEAAGGGATAGGREVRGVGAGGPGMPRAIPLIAMGAAGQDAAQRIVAALYARERTGRGAAVETVIEAVCESLAAIPGAPWLYGESLGDDWSGIVTGSAPYYGLYATADGGALAVAPIEAKFWRRFLDAVGIEGERLPQRAGEPGAAAARHRIARAIAARPLSEWRRVFARIDACVTPVASLQEALAPSRGAGAAARRDGGPALGAQTRAVLRAAGVAGATIRELERAGVIRKRRAR